MKRLFLLFKDWALPISMLTGIVAYLVYHFTPALYPLGPACKTFCEKGQPILIFLMLFFQFNKVAPSDVRLRKWHLYLILFQTLLFVALAFIILPMAESPLKIMIETFMVCIICPTATASGVITDKLGGDLPGIISYVLLVNLVFSILFPLVVPVIHPVEGLTFWACFFRIAGRIFPTLIMPCLSAWVIRLLFPRFQKWLLRFKDLPFWLWVVSLSICLVITTRIIILSAMTVWTLFLIAVVSALACGLQFALGRRIGRRMGKVEEITSGQALGQKNTALMIWASYAFLTPQTAVGGGFYSIWHNIVNSRELVKSRENS